MHSLLNAHMRQVQGMLASLSGQRQVEQAQFQEALGVLRGAHETLRAQLDQARGLVLPPLKNMTAGAALGPFLMTDPLFPNLPVGAQSLNGAWINQLMNDSGTVIDKLARILFKSLGAILALQESIAARWAARDQTLISAEIPAAADPTPAN